MVVDNFDNLQPDRLPPEVITVSRPDNPGFGGGANAGVAALPDTAVYSAYVVLNNDTEIDPGFLDACFEALRRDRVGCAGGPIRAGHDPCDLWYAGGGLRMMSGTVWQNRTATAARTAREVGFIPGTAMAVRPDAWHQVGGFDETYFLYNEDIDLCLRLRRCGWKLWFEPGISCVHHLGETTGSDIRSPLYLEHISRTRFRPFRPAGYRLYLASIHTVYNLFRAIGLLLRHGRSSRPHLRALYRGHVDACRSIFRSR